VSQEQVVEDYEYRVRMHPRHGGTHDLFVTAPDAFTARMRALELCPDQHVQSILRVSDLVS
jgi:hypothetical protein